MKILHVVPTYLPASRYGGPIYSVHGLCKALAGRGHDVHVFTTSVDGPGDSSVPLGVPVELEGVKVWYFASRLGRRLYWSPPLFRSLEKQMATFSVVHLHSVFLWPTWAAARLARKSGVPYILAPRGMLVKDLVRKKSRLLKTLWINLIERRNIEGAACIHVTSALEQSDIKPFSFRQSAYALVPNGVDVPPVRGNRPESEDVDSAIRQGPYILFFGRLSWKKGLDRLIPAMQSISSHRLLVVGNDDEHYIESLVAMVEGAALRQRVTIIPRFVDGCDKEALFSNAALFVLPSYSENFGNTVVESMARGCPVLVTKEVGAAELVALAGGGVVTDAENLARALTALLADEQGLAGLGVSGRGWVERNLAWEQVARSMEGHYKSVSAGRELVAGGGTPS